MHKFFNVIPAPDGDPNAAACVLLYGDIGDAGYDGQISSSDIFNELIALQAQYANIDFRINSYGGEVFAGLAIINAIKNCTANITMYIDGVAASMAAVIALCGKPLKMSDSAMMMIHSVQGGAWGNSQDLQDAITQMNTLQDTLAQFIADKCGKTKDAIIAMYFDGEDHWLTASQAQALGLVDEIYGVEPLPNSEPIPATQDPAQIYRAFQNRLIIQNKKDNMFEDLRKRPAFANCANDQAILAHLDKIENDAAQVPALTTKVTDLTAEVQKYKDAEVATKQAEQAKKDAENKAYLDKAEKEEKFKPADRTVYDSLMKSDPENCCKVIDGLTPKKRIINQLENSQDAIKDAWDARMNEIRQNNKMH